MAQAWADGIGWLAAGGLGPFLLVQLLLVLVALPLWLRFLDRRRWTAMRRELAREAFAAHLAATDAARVLARQLLGEGPPLARLQQVRRAIERHRAARERFAAKLAIHSGAMTPKLARVASGAVDFGEAAADAFARITRLYLKEATVSVAPNVMYGEDVLDFDAGQIVAINWVAELEAAGADFVAAETANMMRFRTALTRRDWREQEDVISVAAEHAALLEAAVRGLTTYVHAADPESNSYRGRRSGEVSVRTLDGLIARFDRGGTI